jgi:hypothetical protein
MMATRSVRRLPSRVSVRHLGWRAHCDAVAVRVRRYARLCSAIRMRPPGAAAGSRRHLYLMAVCAMLWWPAAIQGATPLYRDEINLPPQGGGKGLVMTFTEMERHPRYSIVKVQYVSGSSVGSAMYVVKGCWEIARQRGLEYFISLKEWRDTEGNAVFKIGFANDRTVDPHTYFETDVDPNKELIFLSVKDYAPLWQR